MKWTAVIIAIWLIACALIALSRGTTPQGNSRLKTDKDSVNEFLDAYGGLQTKTRLMGRAPATTELENNEIVFSTITARGYVKLNGKVWFWSITEI